MRPDTSKPGFVVFLDVPIQLIVGVCNLPQICPAIIRSVSVYVVNFLRPFTRHVEPCKSMNEICFVFNFYYAVSVSVQSSYNSTGRSRTSRNGSNHLPCVWAIANNTFKIVNSHFDDPFFSKKASTRS